MGDHAYIRRLAAQLERAGVFYIPCPGHLNGRTADLRVIQRRDGRGDGWAVLNPDDEAWTGTAWRHLTELSRSEIYHYDRDTALDEAERIAPLQTQAFNTVLQRLQDQPHATTPGYDIALSAAEAHAHTQEP